MSEFSELALRITAKELQSLEIEQPDQIAAALVARLETELGGASWYIPSGCQHRREAIRAALAAGEPLAKVARRFQVSVRTVYRAAGGS